MAKISGSTFVVGYSIILLILFVTFSVLMSKVNPDRVFFDDDVSHDPKVEGTEKGENVSIAPTSVHGLIHDTHRRTDDNVVGHCARSARIATTILVANPAVKQRAGTVVFQRGKIPSQSM
ncbi:uncharacterized protein isoform X3 [Choristoneura fumiferana]|uniref:uncharacterized protein isoform X3 n=1 Tax=Choristoneura fumiferana TaxID=7141 RepID=UPI003D1553F3